MPYIVMQRRANSQFSTDYLPTEKALASFLEESPFVLAQLKQDGYVADEDWWITKIKEIEKGER